MARPLGGDDLFGWLWLSQLARDDLYRRLFQRRRLNGLWRGSWWLNVLNLQA
jgi:hypothetical protein